MKIAIGTTSKLKLRALHTALNKLELAAEVLPVQTSSDINDQPFGLEEISSGAKNRSVKSLEQSGADIGIGIESGLIKDEITSHWLEIAAVVINTKDGAHSTSYSAAYPIPDWAVDEVVKTNSEMGEFIKKINPRAEKDPLKYFSGGVIAREEILAQAITCALIEIFGQNYYIKSDNL